MARYRRRGRRYSSRRRNRIPTWAKFIGFSFLGTMLFSMYGDKAVGLVKKDNPLGDSTNAGG